MSSNIWMRCAGSSELRALRLIAWRVVESQHAVSTRKLVDSSDEQELLEELIDRVKPAATTGSRLHYLLYTPFRYPPLRHGSRFGTRGERGIWYGAETTHAAFAEVAFYRLLFLDGTRAKMELVTTPLSAFSVRMYSAQSVDLSAAPFSGERPSIVSPVSYAETQPLGRAMREAGVELFRFPSARDGDGGMNVGAFTPTVFRAAKPQHFQNWYCAATRTAIEFSRTDLTGRHESLRFERAQFLVADALPNPGA